MKFPTTVAALILCACSNAQPPEKPAEKPKLVTGWGPLTLGMGYDEAIRSLPGAGWNRASLDDCQKELALKGCFLSQYGSEKLISRVDGIPFEPAISFNKHGQLTDINLGYTKEDDISREECLDLTARTIDAIARDNGEFASSESNGGKGAWTTEIHKSKAGNVYTVGAEPGSGNWIMHSSRNQIDGVDLPTKKPITGWNDLAYVSLFASFLRILGKNDCSISIDYNAPASTERMTKGKA